MRISGIEYSKQKEQQSKGPEAGVYLLYLRTTMAGAGEKQEELMSKK